MSEHRSPVALDGPAADRDARDNAAWASGLFAADKGATTVATPGADDDDHRDGADEEPPGEPASSRRRVGQAGADTGPDAATKQAAVMPEPVDLSALAAVAALGQPVTDTDDADQSTTATPGRGWAIALGILTAVFAVITTSILLIAGRDDPPPPKQHAVPILPVGAPTAAPQTGPSGNDEIIIPYTATPQGCYAGSTSPKALEETATESAWVCVRGFGGSGGGSDGQVLKIELGDEMTGPRFYKISEIEVTPGWVPKTPGGKDEWTKHRVPTLIRYVFNDSTDPRREPTVWDVDTHNAHGPVPYRGPQPVLASAITMVILATSPAPKDVSSATTTTELPGLESTTPSPSDTTPDPSDATFAISLLQVKGRVP